MFLRQHSRFKDGKDHIYWSLMETVRTDNGPRQRLLCYLGELNSSQNKSWRKIVSVFNKEGEEEQLALFPSDIAPEEDSEDIVKIDLKSVKLERAREFGTVYVGLELWKRLELDIFWKNKIDTETENLTCRPVDIPRSEVAAILAINRLCDPVSELAIEEEWYKGTALDDLLNITEDKIHTDRLYECLDCLIKHKEELEKHLKARYGELFEIKYDIVLYDLTSTYFEGMAEKNPQAQRGYSRDHRPDCKQVCIALVVNEEGFPLAYEVFDGNRADVTTLEEIIETVEKKYGKSRRIWIFDRGIVSEENLEMLRKKEMQYLVGTRRGELKRYEEKLLDDNWQKVRKDVEVKLVQADKEEETFVLCRSGKRGEKEKAMRVGASKKLECGLLKLAVRIETGKIKDRNKMERKIGALLGRYASVSDLYTVEIKDNKLFWCIDKNKIEWCKAREGAYLIRTNIKETDPVKMWEKYIQLTEAEAAFRTLKSELVIRPIWHQKEKRVQAHIMVAFMGYALWVTLKRLLKDAGSEYSPAKALSILKRIHSGDIVMRTAGDGKKYEIRLRRIFYLDKEQNEILDALKISLPDKISFDLKQNVVQT